MSTYRITSDVAYETNIPGVGAVTYAFEAGIVTPANDAEKIALDNLVHSGIAIVDDGGSKKPTTKAEKSAAEPTEE